MAKFNEQVLSEKMAGIAMHNCLQSNVKYSRYYLLVFCAVLVFIAVKSQFPSGYMYASGDLAYLFTNYSNKTGWFENTFVDYDKGSLNHLYVSVYYYLISVIQDIVGVEYISIFYSAFFLFGSFLSFMVALRLYNEQLHYGRDNGAALVIYAVSFLYAVNAYTAYGRFSLPSLFFALYVVIPLLFATVHAYFSENTVFNRKILYCAVVLLVSNFSWVNPAYFVAYGVLSALYVALHFYFYRQYTVKTLIKKILLYYFVLISSSLVLILPIVPILIGHTHNANLASHSEALIAWLASQAIPMNVVFNLGEMALSNISPLEYFLLMVSGCVVFIVYGISLVQCEKSTKKISAIFVTSLIVIIFLLNKGKGTAFEYTIYSFFSSNFLFASLRSYDKVLIFFPFFLLLPFSLYCISARNTLLPIGAVLVSLFCLYPFLNGDLYKRYYRVDNGSDYLSSTHSPLVKIPQEYFDLTSLLNNWEADYKIIDAPWNLHNPDLKGWSDYPAWKFIGASPVIQYFRQPVVLMNVVDNFDGWNLGLEWNTERKEDSDWMLWLAGCLNGRYFLYHKDISREFVEQTEGKIERYVEEGALTRLASNKVFEFHRLSDKYVLPHIYVPNEFYYVKRWDHIPDVLKSPPSGARVAIFNDETLFRNSLPASSAPVVEYRKIDSTKYAIRLHNVRNSFPLVLSEAYNSNWRIYPRHYERNEGVGSFPQQPLETHDYDQASPSDIKKYAGRGWVSDLGKGENKLKTIKTWVSFNSQVTTNQYYNVDFVSREVKGTIQNNNLPEGNFYDTWSVKPMDDRYHRIVNGYANYWHMDLPYLVQNYPDAMQKNQDGGYDFEVVVEFWPQKLLYISRLYTLLFSFLVVAILSFCLVSKRGLKRNK